MTGGFPLAGTSRGSKAFAPKDELTPLVVGADGPLEREYGLVAESLRLERR